MELTIDQALQKGIEAHKAGQVQDADQYYTAILKANPKHPDANHNMGVLAVGLGKLEAALPSFQTALEVNPNIAQFWLSYIDALIKLDRLVDAKVAFDDAKSKGAKGDGFDQLESRLSVAIVGWPSDVNTIDTSDTNQSSTLDIAIQLRESGEFDQAINLLTGEVNRSDENANVLALLSHCHLLADQLEEAKRYLNKAKGLAPDNASVGWNTVRLMLKEKRPIEALNSARDISQRFPEDVEGMGVLGACLRANNEIVEGLEILNRAIELNPNYAEALINRGLIRLSEENKPQALTDLELAHRLKPHIKQIWDLVIGLKVEAQESSDAIPLLIDMIEIDLENEKRLAMLALCYQHLHKFDLSIEVYQKILAIKPDYAEAHYNMGNAFREQGKLEEAIKAYIKALAIKFDFVEAYNNMGNALNYQGKTEEAVEAFKKALSIKPDYAEAYNNMGVALKDQGKFDEAIEAYHKAIAINPEYFEVWNNLFFPLQAMKLQLKSYREFMGFYPKDYGSNYAKRSLSILCYRLHSGQENQSVYLDKALKSLSTAENTTIQNPRYEKTFKGKVHTFPAKMAALVHFGRSGTGLVHSLFDGHPEVSTLPSIYFSEYFDHSNWVKIISGGWDEMVDRFISMYDVLFDASSPVPVEGPSKKLIYDIGIKYGMANVGDQKTEVLRLDKSQFRKELKGLMACYDNLDAFLFFKLVHIAYDRANGDQKQKSMLFYHIHNPDTYAQLNFYRFSPNSKWVIMVREPIQSCESWLRVEFLKKDYFSIVTRISTMLFDIDKAVYNEKNSVGVRLEDLKEIPEKTIPSLCSWLGIEDNQNLYEMTAQGKKWWGDPISPDYEKDGMNPFGKTSITRKVGSIFSEKDKFIIGTLFYPFSVRFGYIKADEEQFNEDLKTIRPLLDEMFDFEKVLAKQLGFNLEKFKKSGSYLYLRSALIERWNTLTKYNTYPNMIEPLKIT